MDAELSLLEQQLEQVITLLGELKEDNRSLRERVGQLETRNRELEDKVNTAASRVEALLEKLPEA